MANSFVVIQGSDKDLLLTLKDYKGVTITDWTGAETFSTEIWAGGPTPTIISPTTVWSDPAAGTAVIQLAAADTATLYSGDYQGVTFLDNGTVDPDVFNFVLTIAPGPGGIGGPPTSTSITRRAVEMELVDRDVALLKLCQKSLIASGGNRHLSGPIGAALQLLGVTPAIPGTVTDADLANVPASRFYLLCDLAEYRLLKSLLTSFAQPDQTSGNTKIQLDTMMQRFRQQMLDLYKQYRAYLGNNESTLGVGSIRIGPAAGHRYWHGDGDWSSCDF